MPNQVKRDIQSPHWNASGCNECHGTEAPQAKSIQDEAVDLLCLRCHDGKNATREAHPIARTFAGDQVRRPDAWPAPGGQLSCITCHDVLSGCHPDARRPVRNAAFLRDFGTGDLQTFCARCHVESAHRRFNPHVGANAVAGRDQLCLSCHAPAILDREHGRRTFDAALLADETTLCGRCHTSHLDYFTPGHLRATLGPEMVARLMQLDIHMGFTPQNRPGVMPLTPKNTVTCSTCHNPHAEGTFSSDSVLAIGAMGARSADGGRYAALRANGKEFCGVCHGNDPR